MTGTAAAAFALLAGPTAVLSQSTPVPQAQPCVNGVIPYNPYVVNCNLPPRVTPKVRGSAPDAGAIIACRHKAWCLSDYVNGP
ncbi:hypothetical protein ACWDTP_36905 [Mycobacterium sp. NPDC003449]